LNVAISADRLGQESAHYSIFSAAKVRKKMYMCKKSLHFEENNINNLRPNKLSGAQKI
jgi:hypothetical protein